MSVSSIYSFKIRTKSYKILVVLRCWSRGIVFDLNGVEVPRVKCRYDVLCRDVNGL